MTEESNFNFKTNLNSPMWLNSYCIRFLNASIQRKFPYIDLIWKLCSFVICNWDLLILEFGKFSIESSLQAHPPFLIAAKNGLGTMTFATSHSLLGSHTPLPGFCRLCPCGGLCGHGPALSCTGPGLGCVWPGAHWCGEDLSSYFLRAWFLKV